jgi:hypothetical protein
MSAIGADRNETWLAANARRNQRTHPRQLRADDPRRASNIVCWFLTFQQVKWPNLGQVLDSTALILAAHSST